METAACCVNDTSTTCASAEIRGYPLVKPLVLPSVVVFVILSSSFALAGCFFRLILFIVRWLACMPSIKSAPARVNIMKSGNNKCDMFVQPACLPATAVCCCCFFLFSYQLLRLILHGCCCLQTTRATALCTFAVPLHDIQLLFFASAYIKKERKKNIYVCSIYMYV